VGTRENSGPQSVFPSLCLIVAGLALMASGRIWWPITVVGALLVLVGLFLPFSTLLRASEQSAELYFSSANSQRLMILFSKNYDTVLTFPDSDYSLAVPTADYIGSLLAEDDSDRVQLTNRFSAAQRQIGWISTEQFVES
jgi:hypothetical protein